MTPKSNNVYPRLRVVTNGYRYAIQMQPNQDEEWQWYIGWGLRPMFSTYTGSTKEFIFRWSLKRSLRSIRNHFNSEGIRKAANNNTWNPILITP